MIRQQLLDTRNGDCIEVTIDLDARRLTIAGESVSCLDRESLNREYIARVGALLEANPSLVDLDLGAARLLDLDSVAAYEGAPPAPVHPAIEAAREALADRWPDGLAEALCYTIVLDERRTHGACPVGASKAGGDPDLPPDFAWPGERFFVAQLELAALAPLDLEQALPARGLLSLFASWACSDNRAFYFPDTTSLERRATPASLERATRHYRLDLVERTLEPRPALMTWPGDAGELELPDDVRATLHATLRVELALEDASTRLFGPPDGDGGEDVLRDVERPQELYDPATFARYHGPRTLALQLPFADGFLYLTVPPCDLRVGELRNARLTYWGT